MQYLRQSTESIVRIGPFVLKTDLVTPVNYLELTDIWKRSLYKEGSPEPIDLLGHAWIDITDHIGWYNLTLTVDDTNTLGKLTIAFSNDYSLAPVQRDFMVVSQNVFDSMFTNSKLLNVQPSADKG